MRNEKQGLILGNILIPVVWDILHFIMAWNFCTSNDFSEWGNSNLRKILNLFLIRCTCMYDMLGRIFQEAVHRSNFRYCSFSKSLLYLINPFMQCEGARHGWKTIDLKKKKLKSFVSNNTHYCIFRRVKAKRDREERLSTNELLSKYLSIFNLGVSLMHTLFLKFAIFWNFEFIFQCPTCHLQLGVSLIHTLMFKFAIFWNFEFIFSLLYVVAIHLEVIDWAIDFKSNT